MSNKKAIEIIKKMIDEIRCFDSSDDDILQVEYERWLHDWEYQTLENVLYIIKSLPDTDEWISVEERLPELEELVFVYNPKNKVHKMMTGRFNHVQQWWCWWWRLTCQDWITHWKSLPTPPITK